MALISFLIFMVSMMLVSMALDYFDYEDMISVNRLWAYQNPEHL